MNEINILDLPEESITQIPIPFKLGDVVYYGCDCPDEKWMMTTGVINCINLYIASSKTEVSKRLQYQVNARDSKIYFLSETDIFTSSWAFYDYLEKKYLGHPVNNEAENTEGTILEVKTQFKLGDVVFFKGFENINKPIIQSGSIIKIEAKIAFGLKARKEHIFYKIVLSNKYQEISLEEKAIFASRAALYYYLQNQYETTIRIGKLEDKNDGCDHDVNF